MRSLGLSSSARLVYARTLSSHELGRSTAAHAVTRTRQAAALRLCEGAQGSHDPTDTRAEGESSLGWNQDNVPLSGNWFCQPALWMTFQQGIPG